MALSHGLGFSHDDGVFSFAPDSAAPTVEIWFAVAAAIKSPVVRALNVFWEGKNWRQVCLVAFAGFSCGAFPALSRGFCGFLLLLWNLSRFN